jgi:hypothetical protein
METDSRKEKSEVCLDLDRPSHGRTYAGNGSLDWIESQLPEQKARGTQSRSYLGTVLFSQIGRFIPCGLEGEKWNKR